MSQDEVLGANGKLIDGLQGGVKLLLQLACRNRVVALDVEVFVIAEDIVGMLVIGGSLGTCVLVIKWDVRFDRVFLFDRVICPH